MEQISASHKTFKNSRQIDVVVGLAFRKNLSVKLLGFLLAPVAVICGIIANISEIFDLGASENTLGYACLLEKKSNG